MFCEHADTHFYKTGFFIITSVSNGRRVYTLCLMRSRKTSKYSAKTEFVVSKLGGELNIRPSKG